MHVLCGEDGEGVVELASHYLGEDAGDDLAHEEFF